MRPPPFSALRRIGAAALLAALPLAVAQGALAQAGQGQAGQGQAGQGQASVRSPILTIDTDRLFAETRYGMRVARDLNVASQALAEENARLFDALSEEESDLARRRPGMEAGAFRVEAERFDAKAQRIRTEQDAKQRALVQSISEAREAFLRAVRPVLGELMRESGAAVILEGRSVFLGVAAVDITDEAIAALDAALGEGDALTPPVAPADAIPPLPQVAPGAPDAAAPAPAEGPPVPGAPDQVAPVPGEPGRVAPAPAAPADMLPAPGPGAAPLPLLPGTAPPGDAPAR